MKVLHFTTEICQNSSYLIHVNRYNVLGLNFSVEM